MSEEIITGGIFDIKEGVYSLYDEKTRSPVIIDNSNNFRDILKKADFNASEITCKGGISKGQDGNLHLNATECKNTENVTPLPTSGTPTGSRATER